MDDHDKILCERLATTVDHGICKCAERHHIAALEAELAAADDRCLRLARWCGDECDRRRAAEALLQEYRIRLHACGRRPEECWEMSEIDAHFARYKG